jgi:hypothetical protein
VVYKKSIIDKLMPIILTMILFTVWWIPPFVGLALLKKPCLPPFIGSMLPFCKNEEEFNPSLNIRVFLAALDTFLFMPVPMTGSLHATHFLFAPTLAFWNYLTVIGKW